MKENYDIIVTYDRKELLHLLIYILTYCHGIRDNVRKNSGFYMVCDNIIKKVDYFDKYIK